MKKLYISLFAVLFAFNASAFDLTTAAEKVADTTNQTAASIEAKKAKAADAQAKREAAAAEKKAALEKKAADKKAALEKKAAEKKAKAEKKAAEKQAKRQKATDDVKNSINTLKGALEN